MIVKRLIAVAAIGAAGLSLAACAAKGSTAHDASVHQGIVDKTISLGLTGPQTGSLAVVAGVGLGAQAYFDQVDANGGVNGYRFKLTRIDDQANPSQTVSAVRTLWQTDKVFALFEPYGSGPVAAIKQYVTQNSVPVIFPYASPDIFFPQGSQAPANAFGDYPYTAEQVDALLKYAAQTLHARTIAVLHTSDQFGTEGVKPAVTAAGTYGLKIVANIGYDAAETNFAPYGQRLAQSKADAVIVWAIPGATQILTAARNAGWTGSMLLNDAFRGGFFLQSLDGVPQAAGKTYVIAPEDLANAAELNNFRTTMSRKYPKADLTQSLTGWSGAALLVHAVDLATKGGTKLTWPALAKAFESIKNYSGEGLEDVSFTSTDHVGVRSAQLLQLQSGGSLKQVVPFAPMPGP